MYYQLDIEHQLRTIMKKFKKSDFKHINESNDLADFEMEIFSKYF
jgi:hypothetical protein